MRATLTSTYRSLLSNLNSTSSRLNDLQVMSATGKRVTKPSDDPSAIRPILDARGEIRTSGRYLKSMGSAMDRLDITDSTLGGVANIMVRAKELLVSAGNGANSAADMQTFADQTSILKEELLSLANTNVNGKYLFAGFSEGTQPYSGTPVTYMGDPGKIEFEIGPGEKVPVNLAGDEIFGDPGSGQDIFAVLDSMEAALAANDPAAALAQMDNLDMSAEQARGKRAEMGNIAGRVENSMLRMEDAKIDMESVLSRYEDADIIDVFTQMTQQENAFKAALEVTSKVSRISILDYLR